MAVKNSYPLIAVAILAIGGYIYFMGSDTQVATPLAEGETSTAKAIVEVKIPALEGTAKIGELAYNAKCAVCHGVNAAGQDGVAPPLVHKIYEPSHHGDGAFLLAAQNGVRSHHWPFGNMPPVEGVTQGDVKNIVVYIRALQRENGIN